MLRTPRNPERSAGEEGRPLRSIVLKLSRPTDKSKELRRLAS